MQAFPGFEISTNKKDVAFSGYEYRAIKGAIIKPGNYATKTKISLEQNNNAKIINPLLTRTPKKALLNINWRLMGHAPTRE